MTDLEERAREHHRDRERDVAARLAERLEQAEETDRRDRRRGHAPHQVARAELRVVRLDALVGLPIPGRGLLDERARGGSGSGW